MAGSPGERYLRLGLRVGRHEEGIVDSYVGPRELAAEVEAEPLAEPRTLVAEAEALLDDLEDGWLRDQVQGLRTYAGVLAGERWSYADEVEACYGVRPTWTEEAEIAAAHERLEELLPGDGTLTERREAWRRSMHVPPERLERAVSAAIEAARAEASRFVELPEGERVDVEIVHDVPWLAFCEYVGELRSRISVNGDLPLSALQLLTVAIHETYPGHHVERACKEQLLVRGQGLVEETIVLVPTPQSLVSEGIAELAPWLLLEGDGGAALAAAVADAGGAIDLGHALAVERAYEPCDWAAVNAALLLHERDASPEKVRAYLEEWALMTPEYSAHVIRFLTEPSSRTYVVTYPAGRALCGAWVGDDARRFRRLLTEQARVGEIVTAPS